MKGAVAAMVYAAAAIAEAGTDGDLMLAFTADEEAGAASGARWLAERGAARGRRGDHRRALRVSRATGRRSGWSPAASCIFRVGVRGTQMHSSLSDQLPSVNANVEMARLMARIATRGAVACSVTAASRSRPRGRP